LFQTMSTSSATTEVSALEESDWNLSEIPTIPYRKGFVITAIRHEPPEPFGFHYDTKHPPEYPDWRKLSQIDYCLSRPPSAGRTDPEVQKCLTITSTIRTGRHRGAQVVVVDRTMVAKIYDPLYYSALNDCGTQNNIVRDADRDYRCEAAAFEQLQSSSGALSVTPAYYGTWTMDVETPVQRSHGRMEKRIRPVRFILMERIHGWCMLNLDPYDLEEEIRSVILKKAIVAESLIWDAGINHQDVCPRNIMILGSNYDDPDILIPDIEVEVKIFDFNIAEVFTHPRYKPNPYLRPPELRKRDWPMRLLSPIVRHFGQMMEFSTRGWCSNKDGEPEKWLWQHFHNDDRYAPVVWDPNNLDEDPVYQEAPNSHPSTESSSDSGSSESSHLGEGSDGCNGNSPSDATADEGKPMKVDIDTNLDRPKLDADAAEHEGYAVALHV
jgi:hypothetical protein